MHLFCPPPPPVPPEFCIGCFPFNQNFRFRQLPVANGAVFSKISKKEDYLAKYTQIFEFLFPEVYFPFNFAPGVFRTFGWMVCISEIQRLSENVPGKFPYHSPPFPNFPKFRSNGRHPLFLFHLGMTIISSRNKKQRLTKILGGKQGLLMEMCKRWTLTSLGVKD